MVVALRDHLERELGLGDVFAHGAEQEDDPTRTGAPENGRKPPFRGIASVKSSLTEVRTGSPARVYRQVLVGR